MERRIFRGKQRERIENRSLSARERSAKLEIKGAWDVRDWEHLLNTCGKKCRKCGSKKKISVDHIVPLSKGGSNWITNIQPLCRKCNSLKRDTADYRTEDQRKEMERWFSRRYFVPPPIFSETTLV